ncbi:MAG: Uma2 family endonuclease [Leptolyngbyaceae cyanobacterium bins.302]|nr:Uma2 family endonuclease [Leptolyngbyaceae cyanobacterium bins.302]
MVQTPEKIVSLEEFLHLPETKPASEYIDGKIIQKPMPQGKHSTIQGELVPAMNAILKPQKLARAFPELRCTFGDRSTVPDISVFVWERIPREADGSVANIFPLAPDWTIEILSPNQSTIRVMRNILHCLKYGTQLGWLIDPSECLIFVYFPDQRMEVFEEADAVLPVPPFAAGLTLTLGGIFDWLME